MSACVNICSRTPLEMHFIYFCKKEIFCDFVILHNLLYFPQNGIYFIIVSFSVQVKNFYKA